MKNLLTIAGSDSSGGAGIQADLKTFAAHGTYGMSVITAVTAQNTCGVISVQNIDTKIIAEQIKAVFEDIVVDGVKIGMLANMEIIDTVTKCLAKFVPKIIVLDPVMVSKSGYNLLARDACTTLIKNLLPIVTVVTPNILEAEILSEIKITDKETMCIAARKIYALGAKNVLLKGGHLNDCADDFLLTQNSEYWFKGEKIDNKNTHGTGCTLSSAITANLAKGQDIVTAVANAKRYVTLGIKKGLAIGNGCGPVHHFVDLYQKAGMDE
ncbi:MAG: bifunctional hydroxymethylpyrimidine kinase/phosphomethylpyrimidine kinase [Acidaminococcaceae bacterium]|nr:bifunctional hydroxymethylpyrimidine kinase/phosphomethylpyrimidine kinase [Acidaminococcaceae bacterium]